MTFSKRLIFSAIFLLRLGAATCDSTHPVPVLLFNDENVDARILREAQKEAAWVLRSLCVEVEWTSAEVVNALTVRILAGPITPDVPEHSLGISIVAPGRATRGAVFMSRVRDTQRKYASDVNLPTLLGCVLAHEIGHLVLASGAHASEGIMKAQVGRDEARKAGQRRLLFNRSDRQRLAANQSFLSELSKRTLKQP
jgi:hypothetical protein